MASPNNLRAAQVFDVGRVPRSGAAPLIVTCGKASADRLERAAGQACVVFGASRGETRLKTLYQKAPCRVLLPESEPGEPPLAVLLVTTGGLTGGDRIDVTFEVDDGACATLTTQAAERIYRASEGQVDSRVHVTVKGTGRAEWLAQETILFDNACLRRSLTADVAPDARLLAVESLIFGRRARGEDFRTGFLFDKWLIRRAGRPLWADALRLDGAVAEERALPFGFGEAAAIGTVLYVGADAADHVEAARALLHRENVTGGATSFDGLLLIRLLARAPEALRRALAAQVSALRPAVTGHPAAMPRLWQC